MSSPGSFDDSMNAEQMATDLWTKPTDLSHIIGPPVGS